MLRSASYAQDNGATALCVMSGRLAEAVKGPEQGTTWISAWTSVAPLSKIW
jgi:hypothetical protein